MQPISDPRDHIAAGCAMGCVCQIVLWLLSLWLSFAVGESTKLSSVIFVSWGITQWIVLVPLIRRQRAMNHPDTVQGLLIAGSLGVLLSSACASMMVFSR